MIVLDCNAAVAMASKTEEGHALSMLIETGEEIIAPSLFYAELMHALCKMTRAGMLSKEAAAEKGTYALSLVDRFVDDSQFWPEAMTLSLDLSHSSYDMFYLLLARRTGATVFTLDRKLQNLCLDNGVNCLFTDAEF